ncbi:MAG: FtsB family cell division protein [Thermoanaerobaculia bacterium]
MTPPEAPDRSDSFRPVLGASVLLVFALLALASLKSSRDLQAARSRESQLETRIAETKARSERLRVRIDRLKNDPGMLERLARENLGMVRPGDLVIELPDETKAPAPRPAPSPPAPVPATPGVIPASDSAGPAASPPPPPPASPGAGPNGPA